ncbi:DUF262 domain-containing protein [Kibdelosporangium lantanae]|uniref:DUF262 domain-containing protein n=1 Tax=Kibdelosporangium lantanae TaxID=1497396 RepID=A0ABW3M3P9_9PSEU
MGTRLKSSAKEQRTELDQQRRRVDFDTYDVTVDELIRRVEKGRIDVAPAYQRKFRWDLERQSALIESIFLGIPVPPLFMATNAEPGKSSNWEVVDGLQRVTTLVNFAGNQLARERISLTQDPLQLAELRKLVSFNGMVFDASSGLTQAGLDLHIKRSANACLEDLLSSCLKSLHSMMTSIP